ncbi:MAG TPA: phage holin family protein [Bryobacteraceae bacterium]|nr:phage holin family protein [Bryobacteraceae bacterium]
MAAVDRSFSELLHDIIRNVQEIVRSEVRLAKIEIREEAAKTRASLVLLGAGALTGFFAILFLLLMIASALALVMANWAAALVVGAALAVAAGVMLMGGVKSFQRIHPTPQRTVETIKENIEWAKQQTK